MPALVHSGTFLVAALVRSSIFSIQGVGPSDFIETHPSSSIPEKSGKPGLHRWLQDPSLLFDPRGVRKALLPQVASGPGASTGSFWNFPGGSTGAF